MSECEERAAAGEQQVRVLHVAVDGWVDGCPRATEGFTDDSGSPVSHASSFYHHMLMHALSVALRPPLPLARRMQWKSLADVVSAPDFEVNPNGVVRRVMGRAPVPVR